LEISGIQEIFSETGDQNNFCVKKLDVAIF